MLFLNYYNYTAPKRPTKDRKVTREPGISNQGPGTRDQGPGTKDQGLGTRDQLGTGTRDWTN